MNKHELILKIKEAFTSLNSDAPALDTAWVMGQVEEYVKSLQPAKEVIPRAWADYIEYSRSHDGGEIDLTYAAYSLFPEMVDGTGENAAKLLRAVVNGYTVEPEKKYVLPLESGSPEIKNNQYAFYDTEYNRWLVMTEPIHADEAVRNIALYVSQGMIDDAPDWVKVLEKVEVDEDEDENDYEDEQGTYQRFTGAELIKNLVEDAMQDDEFGHSYDVSDIVLDKHYKAYFSGGIDWWEEVEEDE